MKDGWYLACPICLEINKGEGWISTYREKRNYQVAIKDAERWPEIEFNKPETTDMEFDHLEHRCGFTTEGWTPSDFMIKIEGNKIVDMGDYWYNAGVRDLIRLMQKNNLGLDKDRLIR